MFHKLMTVAAWAVLGAAAAEIKPVYLRMKEIVLASAKDRGRRSATSSINGTAWCALSRRRPYRDG
jgi:hypothetical protein